MQEEYFFFPNQICQDSLNKIVIYILQIASKEQG